MKFTSLFLSISVLAIACNAPKEPETSSAKMPQEERVPPKMKMTTEVPEGVATPNHMTTKTKILLV